MAGSGLAEGGDQQRTAAVVWMGDWGRQTVEEAAVELPHTGTAFSNR